MRTLTVTDQAGVIHAAATGPQALRTWKQRFYAKVQLPESPDDHWRWLGSINIYGHSIIAAKRTLGTSMAHRVSWLLLRGEIPDGMQIDHMCGLRSCVNPNHLRVVTPKQNSEHRVKVHVKNTSGYRGVTWDKNRGKWIAQVKQNGRNYHLGRFDDPRHAAAVAAEFRSQLFTHDDGVLVIGGRTA